MAIPQIIPQLQSPGILSFSFTDVVTKTGYITFYLAKDAGGAGFLSTQQIASDIVDTEYVTNETSDINSFDIEFKTQQVLEGDAFVSVAQIIEFNSGDSGTGTIKVDAELFHVNSAGTETSLGSDAGVATTVAQTSGASNSAKYGLLKIPVSQKNFSPGEKLRLKLAVTTTGIEGSGGVAAIGHDPIGRNADFDDVNQGALRVDVMDWSESNPAHAIRPNSSIQIPFKIFL